MKYLFTAVIFLFSFFVNVEAQSLSKTDSLKIEEAVNLVFTTIARPNYSDFEAISLDSIRCAICESTGNSSRSIERRQFFNKNLESVGNHGLWKRASKRENQILVIENKPYSDVTVFFETYKAGEISSGHEGGQLGLWFKMINSQFKLAGIETIP